MRIAVIQFGIPIQSYTRDLVNALRARGSELALVTRPEDWPGFIDADSLKAPVHLIETKRHRRLLRDARSSVVRALGIPASISPVHSHLEARRFLDVSPPFDLLIGIEKSGLEIAARFARTHGTPFVYYSLELYLDDHPDHREFGWKRRSEIESHRRAAGTIIQDRSRWNALKKANGPLEENAFFLPVGVPAEGADPAVRPGPSAGPRTVLCLGLIRERRFADELLRVAPAMPESTRLLLHGPISASYARSLAERHLPDNVSISSKIMSEAALKALVSDAAIGLALYRRDYANDRLTAFSSQKIAMYLRAGVPIITFKSESYEELFARFSCGEMIDDFEELPAAVGKILERRAEYSRAAREAFAAIYDVEQYWEPLAEFLSAIVGRSPLTPSDASRAP